MDLPSIAAAKCQAARYAGALLSDAAESFWTDAELTMKVTDESGLTLFTLTVSGTDAPAIRHEPKIMI